MKSPVNDHLIHIADAFFEEICDLHVGEFAFERNRYVEDQVCVGRTFYYAKIVNGRWQLLCCDPNRQSICKKILFPHTKKG